MVGKHYSPDKQNSGQTAKMKEEHANVTVIYAYLQTAAGLMVTTVTVLRNYSAMLKESIPDSNGY
jgi:hypothetical protein